MQIIPDWMNNIHPLIVHFPIALLVFAVIADFARIIFKRSTWLKNSVLGLYTVGSIGAIAAYFSGKQAADLVDFPTLSYPVISEHADLALYTVLFFVIYTLVRFVITWKKWDQNPITVIALFLISIIGIFLLKETAEHGGELVFKYGVGTALTFEQEEKPEKASSTQNISIPIAENGSWEFRAGTNATARFRSNFNLLEGNWEGLILENKTAANGSPILQIRSNNDKKYIFSYGPEIKNLQISSRVNLDEFEGTFSLLHHIGDKNTYDFVSKKKNFVKLGRVIDGKTKIYGKENNAEKGWMTLKAVSSSGHYRGYVDTDLAVHSHAKDLQAGTAGFLFSGKGIIRLSILNVTSLDKAEGMPMEMKDSGDAHNH